MLMGVHFEAQNPITGESLPLTGQEIVYGLNINTGEKFSETLAWLLDQINDERINDGEELWFFSPQIRDAAWDELKDDGFFEAEGQHQEFETDWQRGKHDATADVVDITADPIRNRVYVTVRFYTKGGLSSHDVIYSGDLKQSGAADLVLDSESYTNPITGQPNFVLVTEHIRDGEYERYEYFVIDAESEAKMSDKEILEWQYGEGSVDESGYGDNSFWVHGERLHEIEAQPISLSDALVLERLRVASRNYPYQDREIKEAESESDISKSLVAIDLNYEDIEYCDYFIIPTERISGFSEQELVNYFYDLEDDEWTDENTFEQMMSFPTEVVSVMVWSITPEEEKVLRKFGIRPHYTR